MNRESMELSAPYVAPSTEAETRMVRVWAEIFDLDIVGLDDDFFELGGDSLLAATLATSLRSTFDVDLKESQLSDLCTPRKLLENFGAAIDTGRKPLPSNVIAIHPEGRLAPMFMIHGAAGIIFPKPRFRDALDREQPVYLFQAQGYDGAAPPLASVEEIASGYLRSILEIQPEPPWNLVAYCAGGWIAVEIARQMEQQGLQPANVILVDTNLPSGMRKDYSLKRLRLGSFHLPKVPDFVVSLIKESLALTRRIKSFVSTGRFVDVHDPRAFDDPAIRRHLVSGTQRRNKRRGARRSDAFAGSNGEEAEARQARELAGISSGEAAAVTTAMLRRAYRAHTPSPSNFPFSFIVSVSRSEPFDDPDYPINRLLPNRRVVICGDTHGDAVSSRETAELIQRLVKGESVGAAERTQRVPAMLQGRTVAG